MIAIIDYGMGNLQSIRNAFEVLGAEVFVTNDPNDLERATAIILPGVGAFRDGMRNLREKGFIPILQEQIIEQKKPYLGICLGMQFLAKRSHEHGLYEGLGWIDGEVTLIKPEKGGYKVPHVGWNEVQFKRKCSLFNDLGEKETFYFVHSYSLVPTIDEQNIVLGTTWHGTEIVASIQKGNIFGVQFHPEKSQGAGLKILENFLQLVRQQGQDQDKK